MDRIDLHVEVDSLSYGELAGDIQAESSKDIKTRVQYARAFQRDRFRDTKVHSNSKMNTTMIKKFCKLTKEQEVVMEQAFDKFKLSARAHDRILKVARTIADLEGSDQIELPHLLEAISYRTLDNKYWV